MSCSVDYYFFPSEGLCEPNCPPIKYKDESTRKCLDCQPPCKSCSGPTNNECTSCVSGYYLLNTTCVTTCPSGYYAGLVRFEDTYEIPACLPKVPLSFKLKLSKQARVIFMNFNNGITRLTRAIQRLTQVQIDGVQLDASMYTLDTDSVSTVKFTYTGEQYVASKSLLSITLNLNSDFNTNPYEPFYLVKNSDTIEMMEIYPFSTSEEQAISGSSNFTTVGSAVSGVGQSVGCIASGGAALSLLRMQIIGESIQLLRYIEVGWPPSVNEYFAISDTDPASISLPIDIYAPVEAPLENANYTMPRVFETYELPPFLFANYAEELTNVTFYLGANLAYFILFKIIQMQLTKQRNSAKPSSKRKPKKSGVLAAAFRKIVASLKKLEHFTLRNYLLIYLLSIFQPGIMFSLLNFKYHSSSSDAPFEVTTASLAVSAVIFPVYTLLLAFIFWKVISCVKYVLGKSEDDPKPPSVSEWPFLFEELDNARTLQLYFLPISLVRGYLVALIIALLTAYPIAQVVLLWVISLAFVLYYMLLKPLKAKWEGRLTLAAELGLLVCVTLGVIIAAIQANGEIDPTTSNQIGFLFLAVAIFSAAMGGLITLLQVLGMAADVYQLVKEWRNRKKEKKVHPVIENLATNDQEDATQARITFPKSPLESITLRSYVPKLNGVTPTSKAALVDTISQDVDDFLKKIEKDFHSDFTTNSRAASLKDDLIRKVTEYYEISRHGEQKRIPFSIPSFAVSLRDSNAQTTKIDLEKSSPTIRD